MSTYDIEISDTESVTVTIEPAAQGARGYSILFNADADVIAETASTHYLGYCIREIIAKEIFAVLVVTPDDFNVWEILDCADIPECPCEDDED